MMIRTVTTSAAAATAATAVASVVVPLYTYSLGRTLYVPITCRSNTRTLPETRGPGFTLPSPIVASLCRFRDLECQNQTWAHWCNWLDWQDTRQHLPEPVRMVSTTTTTTADVDGVDYNTVIEQLLKAEIQAQLKKTWNSNNNNNNYKSTTPSDPMDCTSYYTELKLGGEGEPTLNLPLLESLSRTFRDQIPNIIVMTNGLVPTIPRPPPTAATATISTNDGGLTTTAACVASSLKEWGVSGVSVAFPTHDPNQYNILMEPRDIVTTSETTSDGIIQDAAHERLCSFITSALACDLQVELTAVERPDVNKVKTQELATQLGVTTQVRWRPYFP